MYYYLSGVERRKQLVKDDIALLGIRRTGGLVVTFLLLMLILTACTEESKGDKMEVKFTVVEEGKLPEKLNSLINEKKSAEFRFSYADGNSLYLARGYGAKTNGGYSIKVKELFVQDDEIHFITELTGAEQQDLVVNSTSYPYIVVKTEFIDKTVIIE